MICVNSIQPNNCLFNNQQSGKMNYIRKLTDIRVIITGGLNIWDLTIQNGQLTGSISPQPFDYYKKLMGLKSR